ncbi:MAG TPA: ATP-binding cassette domain-containing protein [Cyclobacteriaceae bacterium]|nr:ATP-binding cassette domain-containing protein [Cyclobacteriaceae bacterium]
MDYVRLDNLGYQISGRKILQDINVGFSKNKVTAIIGKSGGGKSTLIRVINGLLKPTEGTVTIDKLTVGISNARTLRKDIGYTVQGIGLFPHLSAKENILLPEKVFGNSLRTHERFSEVAQLVNLPSHTFEKYPYQLSGGEQQRAAVARALFLDPPLLLMDEPFASLDPITRFNIQDEFVQLQRSAPRTVLIVTHDLREARKLADDILVIDQGSMAQFGPSREIFENPKTDIVKELLTAAGL